MKKSFQSKSTFINNIKLPKINLNSNRKSPTLNANNDSSGNTNFLENNEINEYENINNLENKTEEFNKNNKINNKIDDIISEVNKKFNISNKINSFTINTETKRANLSSYFINDFTRKNFMKKKINKIKEKENLNKKESNHIIIFPRITKEKMEEIKLRRDKRLNQEKKDDIAFKKILKDYEEEKQPNKKNKINIYNLDFQLAINTRQVLSILEDSGIIEAYKYLINSIEKTGWPKKDLYEYSSNIIKGYESKWKKKKIKKRNEITEKYFEDKLKHYKEEKNKGNENIKLFRVLKAREENKFIKKLDKSRSSLNIIKKNITLLNKSNNENMEKNNNNDSKEKNTDFKYKKVNIRFRNNNNKINSRNPKIINKNAFGNNNNGKLYFKISINKKDEATNFENNIDSSTNKNKNYLQRSYDISMDNKFEGKIINVKKILNNQ